MKIRPFQIETDYAQLENWWKFRGLPSVPKVVLRAATGVVVEDKGSDTAVGWVYFDAANVIGLVDWITTNPDTKNPSEAVGHILAFFQEEATRRGCHNLFSFVQENTGLHRKMVRSGWQDPKSAPHVYLFKSWP